MKTRMMRAVCGAVVAAVAAVSASAATVSEVIDAIEGDFTSGDTTLHASRVSLMTTDDAVYLELITKYDEINLSQMLLTFTQDGDEVIARVHGIPEMFGSEMAQDLAGLLVGMWAAPEHFPPLHPAQFDAVADTPVSINGSSVSIAVENAPIADAGASLLNFEISITGDGASWSRLGTTRNGEAVWSTEFSNMTRTQIERPVNEHENGVVSIDIRKGDGITLVDGDQLAMHFIGVLHDGRRFDSTRFPGHQLVAGQFPQIIMPGLAAGLRGVQCPTSINEENRHQQPIRKVIIPPEAGFGEEGRGPVPGGATMYYTAFVESVRDKTPDND